MAIDQALMQRSQGQCELCGSSDGLSAYEVIGSEQPASVVVCGECLAQIAGDDALQAARWHCLNQSVWSTEPAVQVLSYRMLHRLSSEPWAQDLLDMVFLDEPLQKWADAGLADSDQVATVDANGAVLQAGDSVTLIKDLNVKGTSFTAKRGTAVRNISLSDNPEHIEGRVNGTRIVIISKFVKKSS